VKKQYLENYITKEMYRYKINRINCKGLASFRLHATSISL